jgi:hypothetical protein
MIFNCDDLGFVAVDWQDLRDHPELSGKVCLVLKRYKYKTPFVTSFYYDVLIECKQVRLHEAVLVNAL